MEGSGNTTKYGFLGAEAIQFQMEELGYDPSVIPSVSTIKRIIRRNKLRVNKKERYKRIKSKGRYTILKPEYINEIHQMDFVGPRHIKGFGPINSLHLKDVVGHQVAGNQYLGKSMDNVMTFLLKYWKQHPIPRYIQTDNGMSFIGDYIHPRTFSRYVRLCLYMGIEVVFIAPAKPWMNGTIERFNKDFDRLFWNREKFTSLKDIQRKFKTFTESHNKFIIWKEKSGNLQSITPKRKLARNFKLDVNNIPLVPGKVHFIRMVDGKGDALVNNETFHIGEEYIGEYVWATIDTGEQSLVILYNDENMSVHKIYQSDYRIEEKSTRSPEP
jgi:transposase InsO family protein